MCYLGMYEFLLYEVCMYAVMHFYVQGFQRLQIGALVVHVCMCVSCACMYVR